MVIHNSSAKESEIKFPTFVRSQKKQGNSRKTSTSASLTILKPLICGSQQTWEILQEMRPAGLLRKLYEGQKQQLEPDMEQQTDSKLGKEYIKAVYCHPGHLTYMQSTSEKHWTG